MQNQAQYPSPLSPELWIASLFSAKAAREGTVIRRKVQDIERYAGMDFFLTEIRRRGFQAVQNDGQIVVFCNRSPIRRIA